MKRIVLTDESGRILASAPAPDDLGGSGIHFGYRPLRSQHTHTVDLPAHVLTLEALQDLHKTHRVENNEGVSRLVRA